MPYIKDEVLIDFDNKGRDTTNRKALLPTSYLPADEAGELNYQITMLCIEYLKEHDTRYSTINAIVGALECAKLELYRRVASPYEDKKIIENGDVY